MVEAAAGVECCGHPARPDSLGIHQEGPDDQGRRLIHPFGDGAIAPGTEVVAGLLRQSVATAEVLDRTDIVWRMEGVKLRLGHLAVRQPEGSLLGEDAVVLQKLVGIAKADGPENVVLS